MFFARPGFPCRPRLRGALAAAPGLPVNKVNVTAPSAKASPAPPTAWKV